MSKKSVKTGAFVASTQLLILFVSFSRNIIAARLLTPYDMAVATILSMIVTTLEQVTNVGLQSYIIKSELSSDNRELKNAHLVGVLRGVALTIILLCLGDYLASLFLVSDASVAFLMIAFVPLLNGLVNLDVFRQQRNMSFGASSCSELVGSVFSVVVTVAGAVYFADFRAYAIGLMAQAVATSALTHMLSKSSFQIENRKETLSQIFRFGFPLMLNGLLLAMTINGDRFVLASSSRLSDVNLITHEVFAAYSLCFGLVFTLTMGVTRISNTLLLPLISKNSENDRELTSIVWRFSDALLIFSSVVIITFSTIGREATLLLYGSEYVVDRTVVMLVAAGLACRSIRTLPNAISIALDKPWTILVANIIRSVAIPVIAFLISAGFGLFATALAVVVFEEIAIVFSFACTIRQKSCLLHPCISTLFKHLLVVSICFGLMLLPDTWVFYLAAAFSGSVAIIALILSSSIIRSILLNRVSRS
jgi:O-antigen/teichoic acid export membrane protein